MEISWTFLDPTPGIYRNDTRLCFIPCCRCGQRDHREYQKHRCYARNVDCFKCGKRGHYAKFCLTQSRDSSANVCEKNKRKTKSSAKRKRDKARIQDYRARQKVQSTLPFFELSDAQLRSLATNKSCLNWQIKSLEVNFIDLLTAYNTSEDQKENLGS